MKVWITVEPHPDELDDLLIPDEWEKKNGGVSRTPIRAVIDHAYEIMQIAPEVSLKITTMKRRENE